MKNALVVGADRGIAHASALQLADRGDHVFAACKGDAEDLSAHGIGVYQNINVASDAAIARMAGDLRANKITLDLLLHGSGVTGSSRER